MNNFRRIFSVFSAPSALLLSSNALYSPEELSNWSRLLNNKIQFIKRVHAEIQQLASQEATFAQREMRAIMMHACSEVISDTVVSYFSLHKMPFNACISLLEKHGVKMDKLQCTIHLISKISGLLEKLSALEDESEHSHEKAILTAQFHQARAAQAKLIQQIRNHPNISVIYESFHAFTEAYNAVYLEELPLYLCQDKYEYLKRWGYDPLFQAKGENTHQALGTKVHLSSIYNAMRAFRKEVALIQKQYAALNRLSRLARYHRPDVVLRMYPTMTPLEAEESSQGLQQDPWTQQMESYLQVRLFLAQTLFPYSSYYDRYRFYKQYNIDLIGDDSATDLDLRETRMRFEAKADSGARSAATLRVVSMDAVCNTAAQDLTPNSGLSRQFRVSPADVTKCLCAVNAIAAWNGGFIGNEDGSISTVPKESIQPMLLERVNQWKSRLGEQNCAQLKNLIVRTLSSPKASMDQTMKALFRNISLNFKSSEMEVLPRRYSIPSVNPARFFEAVRSGIQCAVDLVADHLNSYNIMR